MNLFGKRNNEPGPWCPGDCCSAKRRAIVSPLCRLRSVTIPPPRRTHGYSHTVECWAGEGSAAVERIEYCDSSTERIEQRRNSRTAHNECCITGKDFCCTESAMGKTKGTEGRLDQRWQASNLSSGISEHPSGNKGAVGAVETAKESELRLMFRVRDEFSTVVSSVESKPYPYAREKRPRPSPNLRSPRAGLFIYRPRRDVPKGFACYFFRSLSAFTYFAVILYVCHKT